MNTFKEVLSSAVAYNTTMEAFHDAIRDARVKSGAEREEQIRYALCFRGFAKMHRRELRRLLKGGAR